MGSSIWVNHTIGLDRNVVVDALPRGLEVNDVTLVVGEIQENCLVLRALSANCYRIIWRDGRFGSDGHLVVYPHPQRAHLTNIDLRLNGPKGLGRLFRRKSQLRAIAALLMTRLADTFKEKEFSTPAGTGFDRLKIAISKSE